MFRKQEVRFPVEGGIELSAWLFVPEQRIIALRAITMAHGYVGRKYPAIERVSEAEFFDPGVEAFALNFG